MACQMVAYVRVSSESQARNGNGLKIQQRDVKAWTKANKHRLVGVCSDEGLSGTLPAEQRPGLVRALEMIRSGEATALLVPSLDRLGRKLTTQEASLALAWDAGARVYSVDEGEILQDDPDDPMRTAIRQMRGVMHQLDKALITKRLRAGRQAKIADGGYAGGHTPYGFTVKDGAIAKDASEAKIVETVTTMRRKQASYRTICEALSDSGMTARSGNPFSPNQIRRIALREGLA